MFYGILVVKNNKEYDIKEWVSTNKGIKNQITLHTFFIATGTFVLFFVIAYTFSIIDQKVFIGLPPFVMLYSLVVVALSRMMGNKFAKNFYINSK